VSDAYVACVGLFGHLFWNKPSFWQQCQIIFCHIRKLSAHDRRQTETLSFCLIYLPFLTQQASTVSFWRRSLADNLRIWLKIIWHCCQNDGLFQNKWPKRPTHATYASDTLSSILQFVYNLFWLKLKRNARSKLFYFIIYRSSMPWWSSRTLTK
jgi:hypothetical protein